MKENKDVFEVAVADLQKTELADSLAGKELFDGGRMVGGSEVLSLIHHQTGAARATLFKRIKEAGIHRRMGIPWKQFCTERLHYSQPEVDEEIRLLEKHGAAYFAISSITRISETTFKALPINPETNTIEVDGVSIPFDLEHAVEVKRIIREVQKRQSEDRKKSEKLKAANEALEGRNQELARAMDEIENPHHYEHADRDQHLILDMIDGHNRLMAQQRGLLERKLSADNVARLLGAVCHITAMQVEMTTAIRGRLGHGYNKADPGDLAIAKTYSDEARDPIAEYYEAHPLKVRPKKDPE